VLPFFYDEKDDMLLSVKNFFKSYIDEDFYENIKTVLLAICFFFVIGGYTLTKELKDSVFTNTVGYANIPIAKMWSIILLIGPILLYAKLLDWFRRSHLIYMYFFFYAIVGVICAYLIGHQTVGILNTDIGSHRYFGWFFYFFIDGYAPFIVGLMWAFTNSISKPESVKTNYVIMTVASKLGGISTAGFAWWFLRDYDPNINVYSEVQGYQMLQLIASICLFCVPFVVYALMTCVPGYYLHGYEAAYKVEKQKKHQKKHETWRDSLHSMVSGLVLLVRYPYMLGIMGMIFFWEVLNTWFNYVRISLGHKETVSVSEFGSYLFKQALLTHLIGFVFAIVGTSLFIRWLGERGSLIMIPVLTGSAVVYYLLMPSLTSVTIAFALMRMVNLSLAFPLRESLYIPTTKELKFKTKSWIDGFGAKMSKGVGSIYNYVAENYLSADNMVTQVGFFVCIIVPWLLTAYALGKRFEQAVDHDEVIGADR